MNPLAERTDWYADSLTAASEVEGFGRDPWWLIIGKILAIFLFLIVMTIFTIWYERRVVGRMQHRPGPNRAGPFGLRRERCSHGACTYAAAPSRRPLC